MPSVALAELYALSLHSLDAGERRAAELRSRMAPVLAAGGLGVTLLSGPAFGAARAPAPLAALVVACVGLLVALLAATRLLLRHEQAPRLDVGTIVHDLVGHDALRHNDRFYAAMIIALERSISIGRDEIDLLNRLFTVVVGGMLVTLCGLGAAALLA